MMLPARCIPFMRLSFLWRIEATFRSRTRDKSAPPLSNIVLYLKLYPLISCSAVTDDVGPVALFFRAVPAPTLSRKAKRQSPEATLRYCTCCQLCPAFGFNLYQLAFLSINIRYRLSREAAVRRSRASERKVTPCPLFQHRIQRSVGALKFTQLEQLPNHLQAFRILPIHIPSHTKPLEKDGPKFWIR